MRIKETIRKKVALEGGWTRMRQGGKVGKAGVESGGHARAVERPLWLRWRLGPDGSGVERILKGG